MCVSQSGWVISVELAIGPEEGISYLTDKGSTVSVHLSSIDIHTTTLYNTASLYLQLQYVSVYFLSIKAKRGREREIEKSVIKSKKTNKGERI